MGARVTKERLLLQLKGGDRRSIGASTQVVQQVIANPRLFRIVFGGISSADPLVRIEVERHASPCFLTLIKKSAPDHIILR